MKSASFKMDDSFVIPERLDEAVVTALTKEYRATSDQAIRDQLIESHVRLALNMAGKFMHGQIRRKDDLISAALLGLTQAVTWAPVRLKDNNITPYIVTTVVRFLKDFIQKDSLVPIERRAFKKKLEEGEDIKDFVPYFNKIDRDDSDTDNVVDAHYRDNTPSTCDECRMEHEELIDYLVDEDERYATIIQGLIEGKSQSVIGKEMGFTRSYVSLLVISLREKITYWRIRHG